MYRTTLTNLEMDASHAAPGLGKECIGELETHEVVVLLDQFCLLDPAENAKAEPEILIEARRNKYLVRTGMGQLHVYDPRRPLEPAIVMTALELIAEMDGTAAAARTRPPFPMAEEPPPPPPTLDFVTPTPVSALRRPYRIALCAAAFALTGYLVVAPRPTGLMAATVAFEPMTDGREAAAARERLAGVYMSGSQPGHHGLALQADGTLKLFQLNTQGTPSLIQDTFQVGWVDGKPGAIGRQANGALRQSEPNTLTFCGETYRRVP